MGSNRALYLDAKLAEFVDIDEFLVGGTGGIDEGGGGGGATFGLIQD